LSRTDGVPLFVEELTKAVLESGLLRDAGDRYELLGPVPPLAIPATLQDSLTARLDRLTAAKEVAQVAAVIGREFDPDLLAAVGGIPDDALRAALDQLVATELVFRRGEASAGATYAFKHALVRDAAYQSLLKSRRQEVHARIAAASRDISPRRPAVGRSCWPTISPRPAGPSVPSSTCSRRRAGRSRAPPRLRPSGTSRARWPSSTA